jgi:hypothetical protein
MRFKMYQRITFGTGLLRLPRAPCGGKFRRRRRREWKRLVRYRLCKKLGTSSEGFDRQAESLLEPVVPLK